MNGFIVLHRKMLEWEWIHDSKMVHLFIVMLLLANHEPKKWKGQTIERGQLITGRYSLSEKTGISEQTIRTLIKRLKSTNEITTKSTNKYTIITIVKYSDYQGIKEKSTSKITSKLTNNQPATNHKQQYNNITNIIAPKGAVKSMLEEPTIEIDNLGETITKPKPRQKFGKSPYQIALYYCQLTGKTSGSRSLPAAKELCQIAQKEFPDDTLEDWEREIKGRVDVAKKYYDLKGIKEWSLSKVGENWNKILTDWRLEVNKHQ